MKNFKYLLISGLISLGFIGCMTSPEEGKQYRKITIASLNFAECGDTAVKINRDNPETRPYYDVDLKISKKLSNLNNYQCVIYFGENVENFKIRIVSDHDLYSWHVNNFNFYDSLVESGKISPTAIISYASGSSDYRYFKDLHSNHKIFTGVNTDQDYFDKTTKSFVLTNNRRYWLGYLEIIIE